MIIKIDPTKLPAPARAHRAAMEASATPTTYDYMSGWPVGFGE